MGEIINFPGCAFCHSGDLELLLWQGGNPMIVCEECGYTCRANIEHFNQPLTKVSVS